MVVGHSVSGTAGARHFSDLPDRRFDTTEDEVNHLLSRLDGSGLAPPIAVDLSPQDGGDIAVARVIVPGLEAASETRCLPGRRCRAARMNVA